MNDIQNYNKPKATNKNIYNKMNQYNKNTYQKGKIEKGNKSMKDKKIKEESNNRSNKSYDNTYVNFIQNYSNSNKNDLDFKDQLNEELLKKENDNIKLQIKYKKLLEQNEILKSFYTKNENEIKNKYEKLLKKKMKKLMI